MWRNIKSLKKIKKWFFATDSLLWSITQAAKYDGYQPIKVFPVPGGPNRSKPFGGPLSPVKMSLQIQTEYRFGSKWFQHY